MFLVKRSSRDAHYLTLVGTLVAETIFDFAVASALALWALSAGLLCRAAAAGHPGFDLRGRSATAGRAGIIAALALIGFFAGRRARLLAPVRAGPRDRPPAVSLAGPGRPVVQGHGPAGSAAWMFLAAFDVPATIENALVVQVAGSLARSSRRRREGSAPRRRCWS